MRPETMGSMGNLLHAPTVDGSLLGVDNFLGCSSQEIENKLLRGKKTCHGASGGNQGVVSPRTEQKYNDLR